MRFIYAVILCLLIFTSTALGACIDNGDGTWTTDGNESADCAECIEAASAGDTINVVAGDGAADWGASAVTIPVDKPLNIIGPGSSNLTINLTGHCAFTILPYVGSPASRISGFSFVSPLDSKYTAILAKGQGWRIDNCAYESMESAGTSVCGYFVIASGINTSVQPYGLIDNNTIKNGKVFVAGPYNFNYMSAAWADDLDLGTANAVYIEDNVFTTSVEVDTYKRTISDATYGGKYVFRYNTVTQGDMLNHGLQSDDMRGTRKWEIYGNDFNSIDGTKTSVIINPKAGTGVIFCNADTSPDAGEAFDGFIILQHERSDASVGTYAGLCDGDSDWDGNEPGEDGWPCRDQVGTGVDAYQWVDPPQENAAPTQTLVPAYFWNNIDRDGTNSSAPSLYGNASTHIQANRDYYNYTASFDGSTGCGCGSELPNPAGYTDGVAYWLTSQSCSDLTGLIGAGGTGLSGTLYIVSSEAWVEYYTPLTRYHPLRTAPGNQSVTVGGGSNTATWPGGTLTLTIQ